MRTDGTAPGLPRHAPRRPSIAAQVLLWQLTLAVLLITAGALIAVGAAEDAARDSARDRALEVARTLARSPGVAEAVASGEPTARLQPVAEAVRRESHVDFVVFMTLDGIRFTHPNPALIGQTFLGHIDDAVLGRALTETYTGSLGPSVRAVVPVPSGPDAGPADTPVALVSVGVTERRIDEIVGDTIPLVVAVATGALALSAAAATAVHRRLRRQTLGLGPVELRRVYEHHDAVLHAVREGLVVLDGGGRLALANDEAHRLLGLGDAAEGRHVGDLGLDATLAETLAAGRTVTDEIHLAGDRVLAVNVSRTARDGRVLGTVATFRDHTELRALVGELDEVRGFAEALRAAAHESGNRLHTVVALIEMGRPDEAVRFATGELAASQELADRLTAEVSEPALAALLFGKHAQAAERGVRLTVAANATAELEPAMSAGDLVTVVGNLVDNAIDAAASVGAPHGRQGAQGGAERARCVAVTVEPTAAGGVVLRIADSGPGLDEASAARAFERGWTTKPAPGPQGRGLGLALVRSIVERHGGTIAVGDAELGGAEFTVRLPPVTSAVPGTPPVPGRSAEPDTSAELGTPAEPRRPAEIAMPGRPGEAREEER
ncbi:sensor histidine kinase [Streptodolium elevatio]|uniref:histidine kinase n=1 Tax=Streptodolium elevatio TaxID=3157996 RepID=A0ABV3DGF9_9ACTN